MLLLEVSAALGLFIGLVCALSQRLLASSIAFFGLLALFAVIVLVERLWLLASWARDRDEITSCIRDALDRG